MSNKKFGKGIYLTGIVLFALGYGLFYTCSGNQKDLTEDILPVETVPVPLVADTPVEIAEIPEEIPEKDNKTPIQHPIILKKEQVVVDTVTTDGESKMEDIIIPKQEESEPDEIDEAPDIAIDQSRAVEEQPKAALPLSDNKKNFDRGIELGVFIPKGVWMVGGAFNYSETSANDMKFLVLRNIEGKAYTFSVSPSFCYFFHDNMGVGGRFTYSRDHINMGNMDINLNEDLTFKIDNAYLLEHMFYGTAFFRTYTSLFNSKIIGLFNEARLTYGAGQGKTFSGQGESLDGLYQNIHRLQIGMSPGIAAFVTNDLAIDISVGVIGFDTKWIKQDHNKVIQGKYNTSSGKFKVDLFSINLGLSYYF